MAPSIVLCNLKKIILNLKHLKVCDYICHFFPCVFTLFLELKTTTTKPQFRSHFFVFSYSSLQCFRVHEHRCCLMESLWGWVLSTLKCLLVGLETVSHFFISRTFSSPHHSVPGPIPYPLQPQQVWSLYFLLDAYTPSANSLQALNFFFNCLGYLFIYLFI